MTASRLFWGLLIVFFGLLFLGNNLGILDANVWQIISNFWPLLLIILGFILVFGRSSRGRAGSVILGVIILIIIILAAISFAIPGDSKLSTISVKEQASSSVTNGRLIIKTGAVKINLGTTNQGFVTGDINSFDSPDIKTSLKNGTKTVEIDQNVRLRSINFSRVNNNYNLNINNSLPMSVVLNSGASDFDFEFKDAIITNLKVSSGATNGTIVLGNKNATTSVDIDAGASNFTLRVPKDSGVKINSHIGLTGQNFESQGIKKISDNLYQTDNYSSASSKIDMTLSLGASNITIERY